MGLAPSIVTRSVQIRERVPLPRHRLLHRFDSGYQLRLKLGSLFERCPRPCEHREGDRQEILDQAAVHRIRSRRIVIPQRFHEQPELAEVDVVCVGVVASLA